MADVVMFPPHRAVCALLTVEGHWRRWVRPTGWYQRSGGIMLITTWCPLRAIDPGRLNVADATHRVPPGNYSIIRRLPGGGVIAETADGRWFLAPAGSYIEHHRHRVPAQPVCQPRHMV